MAIIRLGGSAESDTGKLMLPVSGAVGIYFTNSSQTKLTNNFAKNELSAAISGVLSPTAHYTAMKADTGYVQTNITESENMTLFAVYEQPSAITTSGAMIVSTYKADVSSFGMALFADTNGASFLATQNKSGGGITANPRAVAATGWQMVVGRVNSNVNYIKNLTSNVANESTQVSRFLGTSPAKFRVGASYDSTFNDSAKIMAVVIFNKALTDAEIVSVGDVLRRYAAKHGVNV